MKVCIGKRPGFWDFQGAKARPPSLLHAFELTDWGQKHLGILVPKLPTNVAGCLITFLESKKTTKHWIHCSKWGRDTSSPHCTLATESEWKPAPWMCTWAELIPKLQQDGRACLKSVLGYSYHSHIPFLRKSITCSLSNQLLPLLISTHSLCYQFLWAGACLQKAWVDLSRHLYAFLDVRVNYTSLLEVHQMK